MIVSGAFSNYGPAIDMGAPGVQIYSTSKNGGYSTSSGTSMAAPHVAGAATMYMSEFPNASPSQVMKALQTRGSDTSTICDGSGHGYFKGDKDGIAEPLLSMKAETETETVPLPAGNTNSTTGNTNSTTGNTNSTTGNTNSTTGNTNSTTGNTNSTTGNTNSTTGNTNSTTGNTNSTNGNATNSTAPFSAQSGADYEFVRKWGSQGSADGQLSGPTGIALDPSGTNLYVADCGNHRMQKFTRTWGTHIGMGNTRVRRRAVSVSVPGSS